MPTFVIVMPAAKRPASTQATGRHRCPRNGISGGIVTQGTEKRSRRALGGIESERPLDGGTRLCDSLATLERQGEIVMFSGTFGS